MAFSVGCLVQMRCWSFTGGRKHFHCSCLFFRGELGQMTLRECSQNPETQEGWEWWLTGWIRVIWRSIPCTRMLQRCRQLLSVLGQGHPNRRPQPRADLWCGGRGLWGKEGSLGTSCVDCLWGCVDTPAVQVSASVPSFLPHSSFWNPGSAYVPALVVLLQH